MHIFFLYVCKLSKKNVKKSFKAGCNLVLHCNGNLKQMQIVARNSPKIDNFILKNPVSRSTIPALNCSSFLLNFIKFITYYNGLQKATKSNVAQGKTQGGYRRIKHSHPF